MKAGVGPAPIRALKATPQALVFIPGSVRIGVYVRVW